MSSKRNYRRVKVNKVCGESLKDLALLHGGAGTTVGLDVAKAEIVVVVRWPSGDFERPWSVSNPNEIGMLVELLCVLNDTCDSLVVGLESTGTYSESIRYAMTQASLNVHRLSGKGVADYKELFDGVPSQHDGKDAAMIAELAHFGKGTPWPYTPLSEAELLMKHQVARLGCFRGQANQWMGRLEGMLAKHWPELTSLLELKRVTLRKICQHYGSPAQLLADKDARQQLRRWGGSLLSFGKIDAIIESARTTSGLPMSLSEITWVQEIASELERCKHETALCEKTLQAQAQENESMRPYIKAVGAVTLCTIWATVGDPRKYSSSGAFLKALGLNLKELSSGKRQGQLGISKRGPSQARRILFFWAMRAVKDPAIKRWYSGFKQVGRNKTVTADRSLKGLVAVLRKLCRSLWYAMKHGEAFHYAKVFPGKPLQAPSTRNRRRTNMPAV